MKQIIIFSFFCIWLHAAALIAGGPWLQAKNSGYAQISVSGILSYDELFSNTAKSVKLNRNITDLTIMGYGEFGVSDNLTIIAFIPFKSVRSAETINPASDFPELLDAGSLTGFGNIALAAKTNFLQEPLLVSGQIRIDGATESVLANTGLRTGYSAWAFTPSVLTGFSSGPWYGSAEFGVRLQTNHYATGLVGNLEAGYALTKNIWLAACRGYPPYAEGREQGSGWCRTNRALC